MHKLLTWALNIKGWKDFIARLALIAALTTLCLASWYRRELIVSYRLAMALPAEVLDQLDSQDVQFFDQLDKGEGRQAQEQAKKVVKKVLR